MVLSAIDLAVLNPQELVVLVVALGGLLPVILYYRESPPWFIVAYGFLLVGAIATNIEHLFWSTAFNLIEHAVGNMGAGIGFAVAAYLQRDRIFSMRADSPAGEEG